MPSYHIYSSNSGKQEGTDVHVLAGGSDLDKFIGTLPDKGISLKDAPKESADFDGTDAWAVWSSGLGPDVVASLTWDGSTGKNIQEFRFVYKIASLGSTPIAFSSSSGCINDAFGPPVPAGSLPAKVPVPGVGSGGDLLYCGMDHKVKTTLSGTVTDLFAYAGIAGTVANLPVTLAKAKVSLSSDSTQSSTDKDKAKERNALWFHPSYGFQTTLRLAFKLDAYSDLENLFHDCLPGLTLPKVSVVCKKIFVQGETADGVTTVNTGSIAFSISGGSVKATNGAEAKFDACVEFGTSRITFTFLFGDNTLDGVLAWLAERADQKQLSATLHDLLRKDNVLQDDHLRLRRLRLSVNTTNPKAWKLASFSLDIEVKANFGSEGNSVVTFLLSYSYIHALRSFGQLSGKFWPAPGPLDDISPDYETWNSLRPSDPSTVSSISLSKMIPGQTVDSIPETIPKNTTKAMLTVGDSGFRVLAAVEAVTPEKRSVPLPYLGTVVIDASYDWGKSKAFTLDLQVAAGILPSVASKHREGATLVAKLSYASQGDGSRKWELSGELHGLYASTIYQFFEPGSADQVVSLLDSIAIDSLKVDYKYENSVGSHCSISGTLHIGKLQLVLDFVYEKDWTFSAVLQPLEETETLGSFITNTIGDDLIELPDFVAEMTLDKNDHLEIKIEKKSIKSSDASSPATGTDPMALILFTDLVIGKIKLDFAQYRRSDWDPKVPSKRAFKAALTGLPHVNVPLVGDVTQPFDEMYYLWIQDTTGKNASAPGKTEFTPGLTRAEQSLLQPYVGIVFKDNNKKHEVTDVVVLAGSHFSIIVKGSNGEPTCILDYDFAKAQREKKKDGNGTTVMALDAPADASPPSGKVSEPAPLKKEMTPLSVSSISLKYAEKRLHVVLDATLILGPLAFSLIGFDVNFAISKLNEPDTWDPKFNLDGLTVVFNKAPLTIAGTIRHGKTPTLEYYAGGLIIGFAPYQFMAAGFYGNAVDTTKTPNEPFKSVFIFAKLNGPLITFEFATISGVTGGFGYNSTVRVPKVAEIIEFPFVAPKAMEGGTDSALSALNKLVSPGGDGWFSPRNDTYWAAAGMKVDAFQMLAIDAVLLVEFGQSVKLGIYAVATAGLPTAEEPKFARVELGMAITVDFDYGVFRVEGQLSPTSYILDPSCHLTGGFGFCYWFDAPHSDPKSVGQFVFTVGGYHQAFEVPSNYPNPPRLGISWSLGKNLSVTGQAYFAVTPKVCMGGGRLHAAFSAGPIEAWFDAYADFLINYKPFYFIAQAGISVGVRFNLDLLFIHTHISAEIGADLTLWGPSVAGRVHVNLWVHAFDINFGDNVAKPSRISLKDFFELVQQNSQKTTSGNKAHTFLPLTGLMNDGEQPEQKPGALWKVRGGTLSFNVNCTLAIHQATNEKSHVQYDDKPIYAKPMQLQQSMGSDLVIETYEIVDDKATKTNTAWRLDRVISPLPSGLWGYYNPNHDPTNGNNNVGELLNSSDGGIPLMSGVTLKTPPPTLSPDPLPAFNIEDAELEELTYTMTIPKKDFSSDSFRPTDPAEGSKQWSDVLQTWETPKWQATTPDARPSFVEKWAGALGWDKDAMKKIAGVPSRLKTQFNGLYVAAPLMTA